MRITPLPGDDRYCAPASGMYHHRHGTLANGNGPHQCMNCHQSIVPDPDPAYNGYTLEHHVIEEEPF